MKLLVVIVNYRSTHLTCDCLRTLEPEIASIPGSKVAICENGSGDDSTEKLTETIAARGWSDWIWLKSIHPNRGFTGGNNAIVREALAWPDPPEYFLLLNSDTLVRPGAIRQLLEAVEARPDVGIAGPRLEYPDGTPQTSCFRDFSPVGEFVIAADTGPVTRVLRHFEVPLPLSSEPVEPDWLCFACALIRRQVMQRIGLLDEGYFLYFDDPDYCRRARLAGWRVLHDPRARVAHLIGQSNPVESLTAQRKRRPRYYYESRSRYLAKFYGTPGLWLANLMWTAGRSISLFRELVGHRTRQTCQKEWLDIWTNGLHPFPTGKPPRSLHAPV
jgi:N-acetylglucosaminyl-diphospho-decaprenol L-rhamnosyltransferase